MLDFSKLKSLLNGFLKSIMAGIVGCTLSCGVGAYFFWLGRKLLAENKPIGIECYLVGLVFIGAGLFILLVATIEPTCDSIKQCIIKSSDSQTNFKSYTHI